MHCETVLDQNCTAPPMDEPGSSKTRGICFSCGLPVCRSCSTITKYYSYGRKRICAGCLEQHGMGEKVAEMVWRHAGYSGKPPKYLLNQFKSD